jgi:DNA processing protein
VDQGRLARLALALGPAPTREDLASAAAEERLEAAWPHRAAYASWDGARSVHDLLRRVERLEERLARRNVRAILAGDPGYPAGLGGLKRAPALLWVWGALRDERRAVAVVGARAAPLDAVARARGLAGGLAEAGVLVISGGAIGIDTAAHEGAIGAGGGTVAFLGSGIERLYPERNRELFARIAGQGAVVSQFPPDAPPRRACFPQRNWLIAACSAAVLVVEARRRSGALITAGQAAMLGRPVLAVAAGPGTLELLGNGAGLVESAGDVIAALDGAPPRRYRPVPDDPDQLAALGVLAAARHGASVDDVARSLSWRAPRAAAALLRLELAGLARADPGGRFAAVGT